MNDKEFVDQVHLNIHAVRLISGYKPTNFEKKISKLVLEKFSSSCKECKDIDEQLKKNPTTEKKSLFKNFTDAINNA